MAKFAPVAPIQVLEGLYAAGAFGDYHLLLAHHTVEHKTRFTDLFKRAYDDGWEGTIIMDNSIVELGDSVGAGLVSEACWALSSDTAPEGVKIIPVLPDVMGEGVATRELVTNSYDTWCKEIPAREGFMVVCQGDSYSDFLHSLHFFTDTTAFPGITTLGIPRVLQKTCGTRIRAALSARDYMDDYAIHLLGFSDSITDDIDSCKALSGNCGIDSAVPLRLREMFTEFVDAGKRPADWFDTAQVDGQMISNLRLAREMFE